MKLGGAGVNAELPLHSPPLHRMLRILTVRPGLKKAVEYISGIKRWEDVRKFTA